MESDCLQQKISSSFTHCSMSVCVFEFLLWHKYTVSCYGPPLRSRVRTFYACVDVSSPFFFLLFFVSVQEVNVSRQFPCSIEGQGVLTNGDAPRAVKLRLQDLLFCLHDTAVILDHRELSLFSLKCCYDRMEHPKPMHAWIR